MRKGFFVFCILSMAVSSFAQTKDSVHTLPSATVTASKVSLIFKSPRYSVIDYTFFDSGLLIITTKGNFSPTVSLLLINGSGDTLAQGKAPVLSESFTKSCTGTPYIVTKDVLYRVTRTGDSLLCKSFGPRDLRLRIESCRIALDSSYYYKAWDQLQHSVSFSRLPAHDSIFVPFCSIIDSVAWNSFLYSKYLFKKSERNKFDFAMTEDELENLANYVVPRLWRNYAGMRDTKTSDLYNLGDTNLVITDYIHKTLRYFTDSGIFISEVPMEKSWANAHDNTLLRDDVTGRFYIHFSKNAAGQNIRELKLRDGIVAGPALEFARPYAERVSVHDGLIYYLQHDPGGGVVRQLFVQRW